MEYNQKSVALCLHTAAGSSSRTPAAAHSLNLQAGKDQAAADVAKLNLQPGKDQAAADAAKLNLQPDQEEVASVSTWNSA
jgi:hypothetical protein